MAGAGLPLPVSLSDLSAQFGSGPTSTVSRLQSWMEIHIDARIARSLCDFRDHELSGVVASACEQAKQLAHEQSDRSSERLELVVASVAEAQARQLAVVEELSQELARVRDRVPHANLLEQSFAKVELHGEAIRALQESRQEDESQREAILLSVALLKGEFEKQRSGLHNMQQWAKNFQKEVAAEQQKQILLQVPSLHTKVSRCEEQLKDLHERLRQVGLGESSSGLTFSAKVASSPPRFGLPTAWSELKEAVSATYNEAENSSQAISNLKEALRQHLESSHTELARGLKTTARQLVDELRAEAWEVLADHAGSISALRRNMRSLDQRGGELRPEASSKIAPQNSAIKLHSRTESTSFCKNGFTTSRDQVTGVKPSLDSTSPGMSVGFSSHEESMRFRKAAESVVQSKNSFESKYEKEAGDEVQDDGTEDDGSDSPLLSANTSPRVSVTDDASSMVSHQQSVGFCTPTPGSSSRIRDTE